MDGGLTFARGFEGPIMDRTRTEPQFGAIFRTRSDQSYRIGYAESLDGTGWKRMDESAGIDYSNSGWDWEMIAYPFVYDHGGRRYMLYNGNGFGRSGLG